MYQACGRQDRLCPTCSAAGGVARVFLTCSICSGGGVPAGYLVMYHVLDALKQTRIAKILQGASIHCIHRRCA